MAEEGGSELNLSGLMRDGLRELIELVGSSGVTELSIERGETKLYIRSATPEAPVAHEASGHAPVSVYTAPMSMYPAAQAQPPAPAPTEIATPPEQALPADAPTTAATPITSPIVGTYYSMPTPGAEPFVAPGDYVEAGQTVGIVEAMKIMNEIPSEVSGRVLEVLVENGQAVEYGQPLMLVDTAAAPDDEPDAAPAPVG